MTTAKKTPAAKKTATPPADLAAIVPAARPDALDLVVRLDELPALIPGPDPSADFVDSVRTYGVIEPIIVEPVSDPAAGGARYLITGGTRRVKAARIVGLDHIPARILEGANREVLRMALNQLRRPNVVTDYEACRALIAKGYGFDQIAKVTGKCRKSVEKIMRLEKLVPALYEALGDGRLSPAVADQVVKLDRSVQNELVEVLDTTGRLTEDSVREARAAKRASAVSQLPGAIFATPSAVDWRVAVESRLRDALALVPAAAAHDDLRRALEKALIAARQAGGTAAA